MGIHASNVFYIQYVMRALFAFPFNHSLFISTYPLDLDQRRFWSDKAKHNGSSNMTTYIHWDMMIVVEMTPNDHVR